MMVPTAGLEPAQVAPLAPQTSASTNFATSASSIGLRPNFSRGSPSEPRKLAALRAGKNNSLAVDHFGGGVGCGAGAVTGCGGGVGVSAGGGPLLGAAAAAFAARSSTEVGSAVACEPRYANVRL